MTDDADFVPRSGEVARYIRDRDWAGTPLGPLSTWPSSLRTVLRLMLSSRYAMWMGYGKDLTFFYNDAYAQETLGPKHPWALGRSAREVWAEIWDAIGPRIEHVLTTGEATYDEGLLLFLERNGYPEETYHSFSYSPVPGDAAGEIAGMFCVVVEETGRVLNERRLAFLRDLSAALAATKTPEGVLSAVESCLRTDTKDFPFSFVFPVAEDGSGVPAPWALAAPATTRTPVSVVLEPAHTWPRGAWEIAPAHALVVPIPHQGREGVVAVIVVGLNPHRPYDDEMRGFVDLLAGQVAASFANARAYREQIERAEQLSELDRAKTAFFSNVSHEFRTPLTLMLGPTQDALNSPERALRGEELETVHRNELRLLKLVNALLDFARIEAGRTQAAFEPTDLGTFTTDLTSAFRSAIERAGLVFEVSCTQLPEPIYVDHDMWEKIVLNLLSNALKFTFEGTISVSLVWRDAAAVMVIRDTGIGVSSAELPRLFERFHRIEGSRARTHEGSGIGLALVHDLVKLHGGTIEVTSEVGQGTTFTITVPPGADHLPAHQVVGTSRSPAGISSGAAFVEEALRWLPTTSRAPAPRDPGLEDAARVIVADDNGDMREYIARILGQYFRVETVSDGEAALAAMRREMPDLVVSDVMMPRVDGFELVRQMRADATLAALPVILLSARAGEEATAEGLRSGADDYLVKPFSAGALLVRVEAQLSAARLRQTLRESVEAERKRLQLLFEESPAAIAIFRERELVIDHANPRMLDVWGKSASVVGQPLLMAVPELRGQGFDELLHGVQETQTAYHGREVLTRLDRDGRGEMSDYYFDFVYAPLRGAESSAVVVHAFDVTDKVMARRHLEQLREGAEAANRVKDEFLATMSHELRTPLNAILGWAALLRTQDAPDWERTERGLATIERNARSQARLIEDVLDVSRIINGKLRLEMATTDLVQVSLAATDVVRPAAVAKGVKIDIEIADETPIELLGDGDRLQQVVWNLLSNAVKFTPPEGSVTLSIRKVGNDAELIVRDSGAGIPSEHLPYVFDRFRQVDSSSTRKYGGLGLGLAIVRHLVELHGGAVAAESDGEGRGTAFTIHLPMRAGSGSVRPPPRSTAELPSAAKKRVAQLEGVRVLVVDDDEDSRLLLDSALSLAGATVETADSARTALAALDSSTPDIVVSDIGMPEEDGYSFMQRVRARPANQGGEVPAIALTAYASAADIARAERAGFQKHVAKPTDLQAIVAAVASLTRDRTHM